MAKRVFLKKSLSRKPVEKSNGGSSVKIDTSVGAIHESAAKRTFAFCHINRFTLY